MTIRKVDQFKYLGLQVVADGGCERDVAHRMHEEYKAWVALKGCRAIGDKLIEIYASVFAWSSVLLDRPPAHWWLITWKGIGCRYMMRVVYTETCAATKNQAAGA